LILGSIGWVRLPTQAVEVAIAVSILVSAVHAFRPIFPGREPLVAAGFGLVHGLAFASTLTEFQLDAWQLASALLAFNLGIECMQLAVVLASVPWLVLLSRMPGYAVVRNGGALFASAAALGWIGERALGWPNPLTSIVTALAEHAIWWLTVLAIVAVGTTVWRRFRSAVG